MVSDAESALLGCCAMPPCMLASKPAVDVVMLREVGALSFVVCKQAGIALTRADKVSYYLFARTNPWM